MGIYLNIMDSFIDKKQAGFKTVLRLYSREIIKEPTLIAITMVGLLGLQAATLAGPLYLREFFNILAKNTPNQETVHELAVVLSVVAVLWLLEWFFRRVQDFSFQHLESRVMERLSVNAFNYLVGHSYNFFISNFAGSLTHKVNKYSRAFEALFDSIVLQFIPTFLFVAGVTFVLYTRHAALGIALALWVVVFITFQVWASRLRQPLREARSATETIATATLADAIGNHTNIMLFSGSTYERGIFAKVMRDWRAATLRSWTADTWIWSGIGLFIIVIEVGLLGGAVYLWQDGLLTIGDFVLIQAYLMVVFDRLVSVNRDLRRFYDALADAGEMTYILTLPHHVKDEPDAKELVVTERAIVFKDVDFHFHENRSILANFNFSIKGGERIALVGPSGAGKSTITKLLLRFYDLVRGSIEIDGQAISHITQDSLRENIAYVPQEPILFHRTLMENIRYGRRDATDAEVLEAAKKARCHEFISQLDEGYATYVGERGVKLSGGERQRVAIARAILKDAPFLLLDEATSSLDSESEALIQDALATLMEDKTVIVIAHRLSTILKMDRIVVLENGSIVAEGTHDELLTQKGLYQKLWSIQAGGFLLDDEETGDEISEEEK